MEREIWNIIKALDEKKLTVIEAHKKLCGLYIVNGSAWTDSSVIDFVNWFLSVHKLDFRYTLENQTLIDSFKNGDKPEIWHCR